jgi:K+ transporter
MSKNWLLMTTLSFIGFMFTAPHIEGNIGIAVTSVILIVIMLMSLCLMAKTDTTNN